MSKTPPHFDEPVEGQDRRSNTDCRKGQSQYLENVSLLYGNEHVRSRIMRIPQCPRLQRHAWYRIHKGLYERCHRQFKMRLTLAASLGILSADFKCLILFRPDFLATSFLSSCLVFVAFELCRFDVF